LEKLTAIIPTFNEEDNIQRAIDSVAFADEIIVIDSFSTDKTVALVNKNTNVILLQREFDDFSSQKNFAISKATYNWILFLDADERLNDIVKEEIIFNLKNSKDKVAFSFNRNFYFMGKKIKYGGYSNNKVLRLFHKKFCKYNGNLVHEKIIAKGNVGYIKEPIHHFSYKSFKEHVLKVQSYKELQAIELFKKGKKATILQIIIKPKSRFFIHYILRLGFLDGLVGFIIALTQSYGIFIKYVTLYLLKKGKK